MESRKFSLEIINKSPALFVTMFFPLLQYLELTFQIFKDKKWKNMRENHARIVLLTIVEVLLQWDPLVAAYFRRLRVSEMLLPDSINDW